MNTPLSDDSDLIAAMQPGSLVDRLMRAREERERGRLPSAEPTRQVTAPPQTGATTNSIAIAPPQTLDRHDRDATGASTVERDTVDYPQPARATVPLSMLTAKLRRLPPDPAPMVQRAGDASGAAVAPVPPAPELPAVADEDAPGAHGAPLAGQSDAVENGTGLSDPYSLTMREGDDESDAELTMLIPARPTSPLRQRPQRRDLSFDALTAGSGAPLRPTRIETGDLPVPLRATGGLTASMRRETGPLQSLRDGHAFAAADGKTATAGMSVPLTPNILPLLSELRQAQKERDEARAALWRLQGERAQPQPEQVRAERDAAQSLVQQVQEERDALQQQLQQARAELSSLHRRNERDRDDWNRFAATEIITQVLPIMDDLERAATLIPPTLCSDPWVAGMLVIGDRVRALLEAQGVQRIAPLDQPFDPHVHEAVAQEEMATVPEDTITKVFRPGYLLHERVLRPAQVQVAVRKEDS